MTDILILERARVALQEHHDWHLSQTDEIDLSGGEISVPSDDYSDSSLCHKTMEALGRLVEEIRRRTHMSAWIKYRCTNIAEMRQYVPGEDLGGISISGPDQILQVQKPDEFGCGLIARNPQNHADQWYVARDYFDANFEPISEES